MLTMKFLFLATLATAKVIKLDFSRPPPADSNNFATLQTPLENDAVMYTAKIQVGTPPQDLTVQLDTGSSDLWLYDSTVNCSEGCAKYGLFNSNKSSTLKPMSKDDFYISYYDNSYAKGDWVKDTVSIEGVELKNTQFGLAKTANATPAIWGIGFSTLEAYKEDYDNIPKVLYTNKNISSYTYSLYLNSLEKTQGSVLFGGVDTSRYSGPLKTVPMISTTRFEITLSNLNIKSEAHNKSRNALNVTGKVLLDSGSTITHLPMTTLETILEQWKIDIDMGYGPIIPEYRLKELRDEYIEFDFQGAKIKVAATQLFRPTKTGDDLNTVAQYPNGQKAYSLLIGANDNNTDELTLGDSFLTSAYVVYNLANMQISLAQADYSERQPNIVEIEDGLNAVPGATPVKNWGAVYSNTPITTTVDYEPTEFTLSPRPVWSK